MEARMQLALGLALGLALCSTHSLARDNGQREGHPPDVRAWYRNTELTDAAQRRLPWKKCCDHSDVVHAQFRVDRSSKDDVWEWHDDSLNRWRLILPDIIHWGFPDKQPTLFVYDGRETYPPEGGI
jgi:hypothetical protein